jgi:hypothetical protein
VDVSPLPAQDVQQALDAGKAAALGMIDAGLIRAAALFLQGETRLVGDRLTRKPDSLPYVLPTQGIR